MGLSNDLIAQFVKITNDTQKKSTETTVYGTAKVSGNSKYVQIDGSDINTPISSTTNVKDGDRVTVMIKNHTVVVTGNLTSPAPRTDDVADATKIGGQITNLEIAIADKVSTSELAAETARIDTLVSENVTIKQNISANSANINTLQTDNATIKNTLNANTANINTLQTENATIKNSLSANSADITKLKTEKLDVSVANAKYATVCF